MGAVLSPFRFRTRASVAPHRTGMFPQLYLVTLLEDLPFLDFALLHFFLFSRLSFGIHSCGFGISNSPAFVPLLLFVLVFIYSHRSGIGVLIVRRVLEKYTTKLKRKRKVWSEW